MKHVIYDVALADFYLTSTKKINAIILEGVAEVIKCGLESDEARACFPFSWVDSDGLGGKQPADPLTVYVQLPFGESPDFPPTFEFSLSKEILNAIELHISHHSGKVEDKEAINMLTKLSATLSELANKIDGSF